MEERLEHSKVRLSCPLLQFPQVTLKAFTELRRLLVSYRIICISENEHDREVTLHQEASRPSILTHASVPHRIL